MHITLLACVANEGTIVSAKDIYPTYRVEEVDAILVLVNDPQITVEILDFDAGLDSDTAEAISRHLRCI